MNLLVELRNRTIHAKPAYWPAQDEDEKLEKSLKDKFTFNKYDGNAMFFPTAVLSVGCADWAYNTAQEFIQYAGRVIHSK
jgi:hypothetical protein